MVPVYILNSYTTFICRESDDNESYKSVSSQDSGTLTPTSSWLSIHTINLLWIRSLLAFCVYNPIVFWLDYRTELRLTRLEFAYILVSGEIGAILATFLTNVNRKYIASSNQQIIFVWALVGGVSRCLFPLFTYLDEEKQAQYRGTMLFWCCLMRFVFGIAYAYCDTACKAFATDFVRHERITEMYALCLSLFDLFN